MLNKSPRESHNILSSVICKAVHPYSNVAHWIQSFKAGRIDIKEARSGSHNIHLETEERVDRIKQYLDKSEIRVRDNLYAIPEYQKQLFIQY